MKRSTALIGIAVSAAVIATWAGRPAWSEEHSAPRAKEGASEAMITSYAGPFNFHVDEFTGKLVCLRCDLKPGPGAMKQCQKEGHRHALSMDSDSMIHPLLAGTEAVLNEINSGELHGKEVKIHGKYYPSTGFILVDRIALATKAK